MSSARAREVLNASIAQAASDASIPVPTFNISDYVSLDDCLGEIDSQSLLVQYSASGEEIASLGGYRNQCWEESGVVTLIMIVPTGFISGPVVEICDQIRAELRGRRLSKEITVESVAPFQDFGVSPGVNGAWHHWVSQLYYVRRLFGMGEPATSFLDPGVVIQRITGSADYRVTADGDSRIVIESEEP